MSLTHETLQNQLALLYGAECAPGILVRTRQLLASYAVKIPSKPGVLTQRDALLITYGDQVQAPGQPHFKPWRIFASKLCAGWSAGYTSCLFTPGPPTMVFQ